jgi:hypothetical protein
MKVGTQSVLFGAYCFVIHPFFGAARHGGGFTAFRGTPGSGPFFLHDIGYFGKPNLDSIEGEQHVLFGGRLLGWPFGARRQEFTLCHSRHWAKRLRKPYSNLCVADKLAFVMTHAWLCLPTAQARGKFGEYMCVASARQSGGEFSDFAPA